MPLPDEKSEVVELNINTLREAIEKFLTRPKPLRSRAAAFGRQLFAMTVWLYITVNTFIFSVDALILELLPTSLRWIVTYKFLLFVFVATALLVFLRSRTLWILLGYILFFPFIRIGKVFMKGLLRGRWLMLISSTNVLISFFSRMKEKMIFLCLLGITVLSTALFSGEYAALASLIAAGLTLIFGLTTSAKAALRPNRILSWYGKIARSITERTKDRFAFPDDGPRSSTALSPELQKKYIDSLQHAVLRNHVLLFFADKFEEYRSSSWKVAPLIANALYLYLFLGVMYSFIYFNLYRWQPESFSVSGAGDYIDFLHLGLKGLFFSGVTEVEPALRYADFISLSQSLLVLVIGGIFLTTVASHQSERYDRQLDATIGELEESASVEEQYVSRSLNLRDMADALESLKQAEATFVQLIILVSSSLSRRRSSRLRREEVDMP